MPASDSSTEIRTLHFDLSHAAPGVQHKLRVGIKSVALTPHTAETRAAHASKNTVLAQLPPANQQRITHFAEDVPLPSNAVVMMRVENASADPDSPLPELSLVAFHIPSASRELAHQANPVVSATATSRKLAFLGAAPTPAAPTNQHFANDIKTPLDAAQTLVSMHPELLHLDPDTAAHIQVNHVAHAKGLEDLALALSAQGPATKNGGWAVIAPSVDTDGKVMPDGDGKPINQYKLSDKTLAAMTAPVSGALRTSKDDMALRNKVWSSSYGVASSDHSASANVKAAAAPAPPSNADEAPWIPKDIASIHGIDVDAGSVSIATNGAFRIKVRNTLLRHLGTSVDFLDDQGNVIPGAFSDLGFAGLIPPGNFIMGIPVPTDQQTISFTFPGNASGARIYLGSLGNGSFDLPKDNWGIAMTAVFELGVPTLLLVAGAMIKNAASYQAIMRDPELLGGIAVIIFFLAAPKFAIMMLTDVPSALVALANMVAPIILSKALAPLLKWLVETITEAEIVDAVPFVGWVALAVNVACTAAQLAETTAAIIQSPATFSIDVARKMDLKVNVNPDPKHSVWPSTAASYRIMVQYRGGTFQHLNGDMFTVTQGVTSSTPLNVTMKGVPAGGQLSVFAVIYSRNWWICGYAASPWTAATPASDNSLSVSLNIVEQLVPLSANTLYSHFEKIGWNTTSLHHWQGGTEATPLAAPTATLSSLDDADTGNKLSELLEITINDRAHMLGYSWRASGQNLPFAGTTQPVNAQMYAFQNVSYLANPEAAIKTTSVGFTGKPHILYDQFGPLADTAVDNGYNFFLDIRNEGSHLRRITLDNTTPFPLQTGAPSWGRFSQPNLDAIVVHPGGYVVAASWQNSKLEILTIPGAGVADASAPQSVLLSGQGVREGLLNGPVALAITPDGMILVLETLNNRVQAFDVHGNPVQTFDGGTAGQLSYMPLKARTGVTYLDLGTESKGYIYVLSYTGDGSQQNDYNLDIYEPTGAYLATTNGLNAAKMVVSMWRDVYALNYEAILGPGNRTEPSISHWTPSTPPGTNPG